MTFVGRVPFSDRERLGPYTDRREFYNMLHAGALSRIEESVRYLHLIWDERGENENLFYILKCIGNKSFVFKDKRYRFNFVTELFSRWSYPAAAAD